MWTEMKRIARAIRYGKEMDELQMETLSMKLTNHNTKKKKGTKFYKREKERKVELWLLLEVFPKKQRIGIAVVVGFFICWAPFHAQRLVAMYGHLDEHPSKTVYVVYIFLTYISGVLYYLSTTINPLLYHIMSHKFRNAFKVSVDKSKLFHIYDAWG
ncbi:hypothetical protein RUM43_003704 [Polyplax serrata]|uniref:G-protein coupled receptors family 1 profile domain-containing protein n=1 Tax=Polyplax serrata TaxID=468196 RepID=A0AAN8Q1M9_POLSC